MHHVILCIGQLHPITLYKSFLGVSYICPILNYCAGAWGLKPYDEVERLQLNALRYFLQVEYINLLQMILFCASQAGLVGVGATSWRYYDYGTD